MTLFNRLFRVLFALFTFRFLAVITLIAFFALVVAPEPVLADTHDLFAVEGELDLQDSVYIFAENLFTLIADATYLPFAMGFVLILTAIFKRFITVDANVLVLLFTVIIWVLWLVAKQWGYGNQFESIIQGLTVMLSAIGGMILTPMGSQWLYEQSRERNVALFGYQRTLPDSSSEPEREPVRVAESTA